MTSDAGTTQQAVPGHHDSHRPGGADYVPPWLPGDTMFVYGVLATVLAARPGWKLADGTVTLPDGSVPPSMIDKVLIGAGNLYAVGATGGNASFTHAAAGLHTHDTKDLSHAHVLNFSPSVGGGAVPAVVTPSATTTLTHPLHSTDGSHTHDGHPLPPYAALYPLIYVGGV